MLVCPICLSKDTPNKGKLLVTIILTTELFLSVADRASCPPKLSSPSTVWSCSWEVATQPEMTIKELRYECRTGSSINAYPVQEIVPLAKGGPPWNGNEMV